MTQLDFGLRALENSLEHLSQLALGGTAVGTGLNTPKGFIAFLTILTIGFWLMIFLLTFVIPYWLTGNIKEFISEKLKARKEKN